MVAPFVAISFSRTHAILRPEFLSAPRRTSARLPQRRDLQVRLALPASIAMIGVIVAPLIASQMFQRAHEREEVLAKAHEVAESLIGDVDHSDPEALGKFLATHPDVTVLRGGVNYGPRRDHVPSQSGPVDDDGDGVAEAVAVVVKPGEVAVVPVAPPVRRGQKAMGIGVLCLILSGLTSILLIARGVRADVLRASRQVRRVARGQIPEPMRADSFNSKELRELVQAVDRLVGRITEANVAKYVVIEKAQEADRLRSQFLANMSHDLRSPLNSVLGFSELLLTGIDGELQPEQAEMVEIIQRSGRFLLQQIDEILDTAKVDAGRMEIHAEPMPAAALISKAIEKARRRLGAAIDFDAEAAAGLPPVFADPYRAIQALENILVFATERMDEGRILVRSSLAHHDDERRIAIEVITPNPPASRAQLEQVLDGFYRIPGHTGLGLGLPLAGSILELHRGSLDIREVEGAVHFIASFPVPDRRRRLSTKPGSSRVSTMPSMSGMSIVEIESPRKDES
jgi:signal transduction histidine kinase